MIYFCNKSRHIFGGIDNAAFIAIERLDHQRYLIVRCCFSEIADRFNSPFPVLARIAPHGSELPYCRRNNDQVVTSDDFYAFNLAFKIVNSLLSVQPRLYLLNHDLRPANRCHM